MLSLAPTRRFFLASGLCLSLPNISCVGFRQVKQRNELSHLAFLMRSIASLLHKHKHVYALLWLRLKIIEHSCLSVCLCVWSVCVSDCVHDNSKNNGSIHLKIKHTVVYENSSNEFNIGHCLGIVKVKVAA